MIKTKRYVLSWGIHTGSLMSRDLCDKEYFNTRKKAIDYVNKQLIAWKSHDCTNNIKLWFANLYDEKTKKTELNILPAVPYWG